MSGRQSTTVIQMDDPTRVALEKWSHRRKTPVGLARRAHAMLLLEQGHTYVRTAQYVGLAEYHIRKWAPNAFLRMVQEACMKSHAQAVLLFLRQRLLFMSSSLPANAPIT